MGMDTDKIKAIVAQAKAAINGNGGAEDVAGAMAKDMGRSPTFAVAIYHHLKEAGVDLMQLNGDQAEAFRSKFQPQIEKLGEGQLSQIKKISDKLFSA